MKKFIFLLLLIASCSGLFAEQSLPSGLTFSFLFNINSTFVPFYRLAYSMTEGQNYQSPGKSIAVGESSSNELTEPVVFFQITDCSDGAIHISNRKFIVTIDVSDSSDYFNLVLENSSVVAATSYEGISNSKKVWTELDGNEENAILLTYQNKAIVNRYLDNVPLATFSVRWDWLASTVPTGTYTGTVTMQVTSL
ncbi:MAG: hypothetical protein SO135_06340 [Sphaerochaetaceae bacterium]|nr:hypothetical protein [Sphaerochaetaceae bacterium]